MNAANIGAVKTNQRSRLIISAILTTVALVVFASGSFFTGGVASAQSGNTPPVAVDDKYDAAATNDAGVKHWTVSDSAPGVLRNDTTVNGRQLFAELVSAPTSGVLNFNSDGSCNYVGYSLNIFSPANTDSFTYRAFYFADDTKQPVYSNTATVTINYLGALSFAPGETSKTFPVLITKHGYARGAQRATLVLSNPVNAALACAPNAQLQITDAAGRAASLRKVAESASVKNAEFAPAFVLLQYFGYLRRNPTDAPDTSDAGYQFW
jgi:hypothetical protein